MTKDLLVEKVAREMAFYFGPEFVRNLAAASAVIPIVESALLEDMMDIDDEEIGKIKANASGAIGRFAGNIADAAFEYHKAMLRARLDQK